MGLLVGAGPALWAVSEKADTDQIAKLIAQLGSSKFGDRAKATKALEAIGAPALEALRKAVNNADMETSRRAQALVAKIEKQLETAALLAPTRVHLTCKDMPVVDAVAALAKQSKYDIQIEPNSKQKLTKRTVTLDTGKVSFWEALDMLCQKAGLVESTLQVGGIGFPAPQPGPPIRIQPIPRGQPIPVPAQPLPAKGRLLNNAPLQAAPADPKKIQIQVQNGGVPIQIQIPANGGLPAQVLPVMPPNGGIGGGFRPIQMQMQTPGQILLADGKAKALPTCYSGAFRIRLDVHPDNRPQSKDTLSAVLEVAAEPKLQNWSVVGSPKIDEANDDQGQKLTLVLENKQAAPAVRGAVGRGGIAAPAIARWGVPGTSYKHSVQLQLKLGEKQAKGLKQVKGSVTVETLTPPEALITVDNVLKAVGNTVKGAKGGSLKVIEIKKDNNGNYHFRFELDRPQGVNGGMNPFGGIGAMPGGGGIQIQQIQIQIRGNAAVAMPAFFQNGSGIALLDAKGKAYQMVGMSGRLGNGAADQTLIFRAGNGQGDPAKLVFTGQRKVALDVPFSFKDVQLAK
jgi:hypothetical protein